MSDGAPSPLAVLDRQAETRPGHEFLEIAGRTFTYGEFDLETDRFARFFEERGITRGDKVALFLGNRDTFLLGWFGAAKVGAVTVPVNVHLRGDLLEYILRHSDAKLLLAESELAPAVDELGSRAPELQRFLDGASAERAGWRDITRELPERGAKLRKRFPARPDDVMAILYTSGTTGPSKGVMTTHFSYLNTAARYLENVRATDEDRLFTCLPLFHINAQATTFTAALTTGMKATIEERFSVSSFWEQVHRSGATIGNYIGAMITLLYKAPPSAADRDHRLRVLWGAPAPKEIMRSFEDRFGVKVIEVFGLTETGTFCLANPYDRVKVGSCGLPLSHTEVKIVDGEDREAARGKTGEIVTRSRLENAYMRGYYKMTEKTAEAMRGGWFHTGDLGRQDDEGYFYYVDRLKDCIRRRGENISSFEVEKVINSHPAVLESAAVGVSSELEEEDVAVHVVLRPGMQCTPEEIVRWCEGKMAYFMIPRYVAFRKEFPKTATGRIQKYQLKGEPASQLWDRERAGVSIKR